MPHLVHTGIVDSGAERPSMRGFGGLAGAQTLELELGQAVVAADQQRVDRGFEQVEWVRAVLRDPVAEREPDRHRLDAHVLLDVPALQHLQSRAKHDNNNNNNNNRSRKDNQRNISKKHQQDWQYSCPSMKVSGDVLPSPPLGFGLGLA